MRRDKWLCVAALLFIVLLRFHAGWLRRPEEGWEPARRCAAEEGDPGKEAAGEEQPGDSKTGKGQRKATFTRGSTRGPCAFPPAM